MGLEPTHLSAYAPQAYVSTNSTTWANLRKVFLMRFFALFGASSENRTRTSRETGFWVPRVYQFHHRGIRLLVKKLANYTDFLLFANLFILNLFLHYLRLLAPWLKLNLKKFSLNLMQSYLVDYLLLKAVNLYLK